MRVLIDANVLYPTVLREIVTGVAAEGMFTPLWSTRILEEWALAARRLGPGQEVVARGEIALLHARWPEAEVAAGDTIGDTGGLYLPDPDDIHVLAAAKAGGAEVILTQNLKDFPRRELEIHLLRAEAPDDFLMDLWLRHPADVERVVRAVQGRTEEISGREQPLRALLRRARLPRLGKALT
ncbi:RSP_2648 family PIN domain-containing protein [Haematobacter genomosp. 1]|uniref:PIN domain-containing protein n=1 Tax=Haematobacter genomosp. 1 TaxID=366618 RepID=A0A212AAG9_9RHOB|nr:PIN domain-containing protein [Haematobacter genomosp. 1]OWJ76991.1 PIN domain-containing protein [Haematobacter genomosp. 1]